MRKKKKILRPTIESQRWPAEIALATVRQLNARGFALLAEQPHADAVLSALWAQVDARVCERAGRCPVLLIDLNFQRPEWWQRAGQRRADPPSAEVAHTAGTERAALLIREILMDGLTIGRTTPRALSLIFGMAPPVHLKARWPESRSFWKRLLEAAIGTDDQALANVHLHCLQLLGSELVLTLS
jgi:hypothetical protein